MLGTCGGFQHAPIEIARNVAALSSADHEESNPHAEDLVMHRLACALSEDERDIRLLPGSRLASIYGRPTVREGYQCSFGVNPKYRGALERACVRFTATDNDGEPRAFELEGHRFFLGALFQLELAALRAGVPPVVVAFLGAATRS